MWQTLPASFAGVSCAPEIVGTSGESTRRRSILLPSSALDLLQAVTNGEGGRSLNSAGSIAQACAVVPLVDANLLAVEFNVLSDLEYLLCYSEVVDPSVQAFHDW